MRKIRIRRRQIGLALNLSTGQIDGEDVADVAYEGNPHEGKAKSKANGELIPEETLESIMDQLEEE